MKKGFPNTLRHTGLVWALCCVVALALSSCARPSAIVPGDLPVSNARTGTPIPTPPTQVASPNATAFGAGDCTLGPTGSPTQVHSQYDFVIQVPPGWAQTTDVGPSETLLIRLTAPQTYSNSPTTIEIASLIGMFDTARQGAQSYFSPDSGLSSMQDCQIGGDVASFYQSSDGGQPVYRIFLIHHRLIYLVTLKGSAGFDPRAISDTKSLLGSWSWLA